MPALTPAPSSPPTRSPTTGWAIPPARAADSSGNNASATYVGGVQLGQSGPLPFDPESAVTLNGSTGFVQLPKLTNDFTGGFSATIWADPTAVGSYQRFFDLGNGSYADNIVLYRVGTTNNLGFVVFDGSSAGTPIIANNAITLNQWQYFAVSMDAHGNVMLYKNGVVIATGTTDVPARGSSAAAITSARATSATPIIPAVSTRRRSSQRH